VALLDTKAWRQPLDSSQAVCHVSTCAIVNSRLLSFHELCHSFVLMPQLYWLLTIEYMYIECLTHTDRPTIGLPHAAFVLSSNTLTVNLLAIARLRARPSAEAVTPPSMGGSVPFSSPRLTAGTLGVATLLRGFPPTP